MSETARAARRCDCGHRSAASCSPVAQTVQAPGWMAVPVLRGRQCWRRGYHIPGSGVGHATGWSASRDTLSTRFGTPAPRRPTATRVTCAPSWTCAVTRTRRPPLVTRSWRRPVCAAWRHRAARSFRLAPSVNAGVIFTLSCMSAVSIEDTISAVPGPHWFQLYVWRDREHGRRGA